jgi:hypothetical protein
VLEISVASAWLRIDDSKHCSAGRNADGPRSLDSVAEVCL